MLRNASCCVQLRRAHADASEACVVVPRPFCTRERSILQPKSFSKEIRCRLRSPRAGRLAFVQEDHVGAASILPKEALGIRTQDQAHAMAFQPHSASSRLPDLHFSLSLSLSPQIPFCEHVGSGERRLCDSFAAAVRSSGLL